MLVKVAIRKTILFLGIVFCITSGTAKSQENAVQPQNIYSSDFVIDGMPRTINFYIPFNYGKYDTTYPVIFFLHAEAETGKTIIKKYGDAIHQLADSSEGIVVYPDAVNGHWNTKIGEHASTDSINDIGFFSILTDYFVQRYHGDPGRVYAAGFYSGGQMAWRFGCATPDKVTAIAPFISSVQALAKACTPGVYFDSEKLMPQPGKKISNEAIRQAWNFLMNQKKP